MITNKMCKPKCNHETVFLSNIQLNLNIPEESKKEFVRKVISKYEFLSEGVSENTLNEISLKYEQGGETIFLIKVFKQRITIAGEGKLVNFHEWSKKTKDILSIALNILLKKNDLTIDYIDLNVIYKLDIAKEHYSVLKGIVDKSIITNVFNPYWIKGPRSLSINMPLSSNHTLVMQIKTPTSPTTKKKQLDTFPSKIKQPLTLDVGIAKLNLLKDVKIPHIINDLFDYSMKFISSIVIDKFINKNIFNK